MAYTATLESVRSHPLSEWYAGAKLGIFIHWGLFSVPAYAPTRQGDIQQLLKTQPQEFFFANQPYAEWYWNSLRIPGSPVQRYHQEKYGAQVQYTDFAGEFNRQSAQWDPAAWADLFRRAGARYVVLVTKHHDGFLLWPSRQPNPNLPRYCAARDIAGELAQAVRQQGLRMGYYYSSALDWTFTEKPIRDFADLLTSGPLSAGYARYVEAHWHELIDRYQAEILWSDIGYPPGSNLNALFADFYNHNPQGVVNDRWTQLPGWMRNRVGRWLLNALIRRSLVAGGSPQSMVPHCDYLTTEYSGFENIQAKKWEACRGIGNSFGFNQAETPDDYLTPERLVALLVDIVSKNGNLLLNIGPRADGSLSEPQRLALEGLGDWLAVHGEAIYDTHPWVRAADYPPEGGRVCYTARGETLYAHLLDPHDTHLTLPGVALRSTGRASLLGSDQAIRWIQAGQGLVVNLPEQVLRAQVPVLRLHGVQ